MINILKNCQTGFIKFLQHDFIPTSSEWEFPFLYIFAKPYYCLSFKLSLIVVNAVSYYGFDLLFLMTDRNVYSDPLSILNWVICLFIIELYFYIFRMQVPYQMYVLKAYSLIMSLIFSNSSWYYFSTNYLIFTKPILISAIKMYLYH
jgi:hypothetical protein